MARTERPQRHHLEDVDVVVDEKKNETSPIPARDEEEDGKVVAADLDSLKRSAADDDDDAESNKKAKVDE